MVVVAGTQRTKKLVFVFKMELNWRKCGGLMELSQFISEGINGDGIQRENRGLSRMKMVSILLWISIQGGA
jgi:hypothetical protein